MINKELTGVLVASVLAAHTLLSNAAACGMPSGKTWTNELDSRVELTVDGAGKISGTYTSAVGCNAGVPQPVTGFCNGHAVTFSVNWGHCNSTTTWSGTYRHRAIKTIWQLVLAGKPTWHSVLTGSDAFRER